MYTTLKQSFYRICLLTGMIFILQGLRAGNGGIVAKAVLDGSQYQIKVDSMRTVQDSAFFNPSYSGLIDTSYRVQNVVTLMINEASFIYLRSAFSVTVRLNIWYSNGANDTSSINRDFTINYDSAHTYNSRSSFVFSGAHKVTVKVVSITSNVSSWDPTTALVIENQLVAKPDFSFSCSATVGDITVNPSADPHADELPVNWTAVLGADQYDLEWTYIDKHALDSNRYGNPLKPALVFLNNASRVSVSSTSYNIPLIYDDSGTLFIRVRPVQIKAGDAVTTAIWSSDASPSVMGQYEYVGHERPLNWQSNISFAEEGKRKVVVQYFDGSLRGRQTVTKDNTTNTAIVAETYYDYQGRPAIQVMPSPTLKSFIQYTAGFNVGVNGVEYTQSNYDSLANPALYCSMHADPMSSDSGASLYYSPNNPSRFAGMNQFIPDAKNYPFTETEYTPDNTGRISRQGGVGPIHQLGSGHETKYFYGTPDQNELDALFGTEVGYYSHYFKNMVRDANGQYSISYVDMHGRTIATALAGAAPSSLATLPSNQNNMVTENLADSNSVFFDGQSIISKKSLLVPVPGDYQFHYRLDPSSFSEAACSAQDICYTCLYDLEITVTDNCNNQLLPGSKAFDTVLHNFSLGSIPTSCPANPDSIGLSFTLPLQEGNYEITKKLTVNHDAYVFYRDSIYLPNNTCRSLQDFIDDQRDLIAAANTQCAPSCGACRDSVGTWSQFWSNFISKTGLSPSDTVAFKQEALTAYQNALSSCNALCGDSSSADNDVRNAMLQDMTPPYGQYADTAKGINTDKFSIFYAPQTDTNFIPVYKLSAVDYRDANGNPDNVYNQESDLMVDPGSLTITQFVQNFRSSWAEALLPYHPEYCKLLALQAQKPSNLWDRRMEAIDNYQDAHDLGFLNPTGISAISDQYPIVTANIDPLSTESSALKNALQDKLNKYVQGQGGNPDMSMWALACIMVKCDSADLDCVNFYTGDRTQNFNPATMCTGDLDMAWRNFRQLYLGVKYDIVTNLVSNPSGCTPTDTRVYNKVPSASDLFAAKHHSEFNDTKANIAQTELSNLNFAGNGPTAAGNAQAIVNDSLQSYYKQTSEAYKQQWAQQLAPCNYGSALQDSILPRLYGICLMACDAEHPMGASSLPAGLDFEGFPSFDSVINKYNRDHSIMNTLTCNAELITAPLPYDRQPVYSYKPVFSRPSDCECELINDLYNSYTLANQGDASFSAYLQRTQQIAMSNDDLDQLRTMCSNTTGSASCIYLSKPILLPGAMQCNTGASCTTCTVIDSLYHDYLARYPADTPAIGNGYDTTQAQKNLLFQNYMNNRLGFGKQAWEYLEFMDTCASHAGDISDSTKCLATPIANIFNSGGTDQTTDIRPTADGGYIIVGNTTAGGFGAKNAYIARADHAGVIQWAKAYGGTQDDEFVRVKPTSDNGYIAVGTTKSSTHSNGDMYIVKLNASGNTMWSKVIGFGSSNGERGVDIIQTHDGGYAVLGNYDWAPFTADFLLVRLNATGSVTWARQFGTTTSDISIRIAEDDDTLLVTGSSWNNPLLGGVTGPQRYLGALYKFNESTGVVNDTFDFRNATSTDSSIYLVDIFPNANGYLFETISFRGDGTGGGKMASVRMSKTGTVQSFNEFAPPGSSTNAPTGAVIATSDGGYLMGETGDATSNIYWKKISSAGSTDWTVQTALPNTQTLGRVTQNADNTFTLTGTDDDHVMVLKLSSSGNTGCYDNAASLGSKSLSLERIAWEALSNNNTLTASNTDISLSENYLALTASAITCPGGGECYNIYKGPMLCGKSMPLFPPVPIDSITTCSDSTFFAISKGTELYNGYRDSLTGDFERRYLNTCLQAYRYESFTVKHQQNEYHYTLYYYDQAGNLVKTIPPAGVDQHTSTGWLDSVRAARAAGAIKVPSHSLVTNYRYNTLNQVVAQQSPDGGLSHFWYDRLGRLAVSQNAKQNADNNYSYTLYDSIGRITEVGQLTSATAITDAISRSQSLLADWQDDASSTREQVTQTTYDVEYSPLLPVLWARNLRNRVSRTALYKTATDIDDSDPAASTFFSYDILGNVDTLVQDFGRKSFSSTQNLMNRTGNRFKKIVYQYDLVSGKVNQVSFQHGQLDAFYHTYLYDAENRITDVQTSRDSINWDNDAFYSYYAHGPLARTILGEQQVQGVNYAYTLHGWLKAVNPAIYSGAGYTLQPDGSPGSVVGANAYDFILNYYDSDYVAISKATPMDTLVKTTLGSEYRPLFNGNISSMGVNITALAHPLLYNYQYDQLNRLVNMDAWKRNSTPWHDLTKLPDFKEHISYDPNGNILTYTRHGNNTFAGQPVSMDSMTYSYKTNSNQLDYIADAVSSSNYPTDIDNQSPGNYSYDPIGDLTKDDAEGITDISWTVYGKISSITKSSGTKIDYTYDASGNRISKSVINGSDTTSTWYVRDAQGNVLSVYNGGIDSINNGDLSQTELHLYGSSRLGILKASTNVEHLDTIPLVDLPSLGTGYGIDFKRGNKLFELTNHLGNVLVTVSDKKFGHKLTDSTVDYFNPDVVSANDYYPFGSLQPGREFAQSGSGNYRYGFNGKENDNEVKGMGNSLDFGNRIYDPRVGRFLSVDPLFQNYPELGPYQSSANNPIEFIDANGDAPIFPSWSVTNSLLSNHPIGTYALIMAVNTSPKELYKWATRTSTDKMAYYKLKGAFGEAESYKRLLSDFTVGFKGIGVPAPRTVIGAIYDGLQVDIQTKARSYTTKTWFGSVRQSVGIRNYSFEGNENEIASYGKEKDAEYTINYEVKTLSPKNDVGFNFRILAEGLRQTAERSKGENTVGVLITDKEAWLNVANDPIYGAQLKTLYNNLPAGAYLRLETDLSGAAHKELMKAYSTIKKADEQEKSGNKKQ